MADITPFKIDTAGIDDTLDAFYDDAEALAQVAEMTKSQDAWNAAKGGSVPDGVENYVDDATPDRLKDMVSLYEQIKTDPKQVKQFAILNNLQKAVTENGWGFGDEKAPHPCKMEYKDGALLMRVNDQSGSGLKFAIRNDMSIVFTKGSALNENQIAQLAAFMDQMDLKLENFDNAKDLKCVDKDGNDLNCSFQEKFTEFSLASLQEKSYEELQDLRQEYYNRGINSANLNAVLAERAESGNTNGRNVETSAAEPAESEQSGQELGIQLPFEEYMTSRPKKSAVGELKKAAKFRAGMMRIPDRCIRSYRMPDGSYVMGFYNSEADKHEDGKYDERSGTIKHTKKYGLRFYPGQPPKVGIYLPQNGKMEGGVAKGILKGFKEAGYDYFDMGNAGQMGKDVFGALIEASGDQLVCPRLKSKDYPDGIDFDNDQLLALLKAMNDNPKGSPSKKHEFKMRLVREIFAHCQYKGDKNMASELGKSAVKMEAELKLFYLRSSYEGEIQNWVKDGIEGKFGQAWTQLDTACAYEAYGKLAQAVERGYYETKGKNGEILQHPFKFDYMNRDAAANRKLCMDFMQTQMYEVRGSIINRFQDYFGEDSKNATKSGSSNALRQSIATMNRAWADIAERTGAENAQKWSWPDVQTAGRQLSQKELPSSEHPDKGIPGVPMPATYRSAQPVRPVSMPMRGEGR